uniref:Cuticular protein n=1 Tax=Papilio xuthus TaxID=66420 RepID=I4DJ54_PAPXU|nr:unknown secreted protein [Papilio xuthus]
MSKFTVILALIALIALVSARPQVDVVDQDPGSVDVVDQDPGSVNVIGGGEQVNIVDNDNQGLARSS